MSGPLPPSTGSSLFDRTSQWFERARASLVAELPCRKGCHRCCIGLFPVTILDRQALQRGLSTLPTPSRHAIERKAAQQVALLTAAAPALAAHPFVDDWPDDKIDRFVERYRDLPCPALAEDGSCVLYDYRPLACRSMGIPPEADGVVQGACEIQTFVPVRRLLQALRREEDQLAEREAEELAAARRETQAAGEELLLPSAFLPAKVAT